MFLPVNEQLKRIREGAERIVPEGDLAAKLERATRARRLLIVKQGFDPTRPDLHIGHGVSIHKLRTFQELGHRVVFVMGDFTARVGDPSGRDDTRPMLSEEEIEANLATYEDQLFNLLLGRTLQERAGQEPQVCLIMPLLRGTDGHRKMSKSYGNYIGISTPPNEAFGRAMSIPHALLDEWLVLASGTHGKEIAARREQARTDPLGAKRWLARNIVARYHGTSAAATAREAFDRLHRRREVPEDIPAVTLGLAERQTAWIAHVLRDTGLAASSSEAGRLIRQGAVRIDGDVVRDRNLQLPVGEYLVQRGKRRFTRVSIQP